MRVLAIDPGIWNFSYCIAYTTPGTGVTVKQWCNINMLHEAGYSEDTRNKIKVTEMTQTFLSHVFVSALERMFPPSMVRHDFDKIVIENQVRGGKRSGRMPELATTIFNYFTIACSSRNVCCWAFPDIHMMDPKLKFDEGKYFRLSAAALIPGGTGTKPSYAQRKAYGVRLANTLINHLDGPDIPDNILAEFASTGKKDDMADSLLLAAVALRGL